MKDQPARGYQQIVRKSFSVRPVAWFLSHVAHRVDRFLILTTNGRISAAKLLAGLPTVCLTTTGARSGQPRTVPLLGIPAGDKMILIASNWGHGFHPAWYYNIRANPEVQVVLNGRTIDYLAQEARGKERQRYWQQAVKIYPGYESYKKWTNGREIPVIILAQKVSTNKKEEKKSFFSPFR